MNNLRILQRYSNSILNKIQELQVIVKNLKVDIIFLSETDFKLFSYLKIPNYHTFRLDFPPIRGSLAHDDAAILEHRRIVLEPKTRWTALQSTSIINKINNTEILTTAVYKPPNHATIQYILKL